MKQFLYNDEHGQYTNKDTRMSTGKSEWKGKKQVM